MGIPPIGLLVLSVPTAPSIWPFLTSQMLLLLYILVAEFVLQITFQVVSVDMSNFCL